MLNPTVTQPANSAAVAAAAVNNERERQNRTAYRYGLCMVCLGVILNWLGFYEHSLNPVRYLGLGCVLGGGVLISAVMCRSLKHSNAANRAAAAGAASHHGHGGGEEGNRQDLMEAGMLPSTGAHGVHIHGQHLQQPPIWMTKPPDYFTVVGQPQMAATSQQPYTTPIATMAIPPPSYEEAMASWTPAEVSTGPVPALEPAGATGVPRIPRLPPLLHGSASQVSMASNATTMTGVSGVSSPAGQLPPNRQNSSE